MGQCHQRLSKCHQGLSDSDWYRQCAGFLSDAVDCMFKLKYLDYWEHFASTNCNAPRTATNFMSLEYLHDISMYVSVFLYPTQFAGILKPKEHFGRNVHG